MEKISFQLMTAFIGAIFLLSLEGKALPLFTNSVDRIRNGESSRNELTFTRTFSTGTSLEELLLKILKKDARDEGF